MNLRSKGLIAAVILAFFNGALGIFFRSLNAHFSVWQQNYLRIVLALVLGTIVFFPKLNFKKLRLISKAEWLLLVSRAASFYLAGNILFTFAINMAKYSNVA